MVQIVQYTAIQYQDICFQTNEERRAEMIDLEILDAVPCSSCRCKGNQECNHYPLNDIKLCELESVTLICPCCKLDINHMQPKPSWRQYKL